MPTKPNRAGQQQNYVPQGNGDASGEYADEATGSNIHFTNFKKPDDQEQKKFGNFTKETDKENDVDITETKRNVERNLLSRFEIKSRGAFSVL